MRYDNPASRLKNILELGMNETKTDSSFDVWKRILGVSINDNTEFYRALGEVMELPGKVVFLIKAHYPHLLEQSALWRTPIDTAFYSQQLGGRWETFINHIDPNCLAQLGLLAEILSVSSRTDVIAEEKLTKLIETFNALVAEVETSDLPVSIRVYLVRELMELLTAIRHYKITGGELIAQKVEGVFGRALRDNSLGRFLVDHELGRRVLDNLQAAAAVVTIYAGMQQIALATVQLLPQ